MYRRLTVARFLDLVQVNGPVTVSGTIDEILIDDSSKDFDIIVHDGSTIRPLKAHLGGCSPMLDGLTKWLTIQLQGERTICTDQTYELRVFNAEVLGQSDSTNPLIDGPAAILAHPHLRLRTLWQGLLMRFRSATMAAVSDYLLNHPDGPFHQVHHPVITWTDREGGAEVFPDWPQVTHAEAVRLMMNAESEGKVEFEQKPSPEIDFSTEHEIFILEHLRRPVFVTHFTTRILLFSALQSSPPKDSQSVQTTESVDWLLPGVAEVFSGGLQEHRLDRLIQAMREENFLKDKSSDSVEVKREQYPYLREGESLGSLRWFADLRRYGTTPHGGFGIGFERLLVYLTGVESMKDVLAFPRAYQAYEA